MKKYVFKMSKNFDEKGFAYESSQIVGNFKKIAKIFIKEIKFIEFTKCDKQISINELGALKGVNIAFYSNETRLSTTQEFNRLMAKVEAKKEGK